MTDGSVMVSTGSRLHFGLLDTVDPFGGAGVMVDTPVTHVTVRAADCFSCDSPASDRIVPIIQRIVEIAGWKELPDCRVSVVRYPPSHSGLGSGTQLAMATAEAVCRFSNLELEPLHLAADVAMRGKRSAVGVHGYFRGGLIFEAAEETCRVNPLRHRVEVPSQWCVAVFRPAECRGHISGGVECDQFAKLSPADSAASNALREIVVEQILPAADAGDFDQFAESLQDYNAKSGTLFAAAQGGPYNGPEVTELVQRLLRRGARGVGQSSWGPGVFAWFETRQEAEAYCSDLDAETSVLAVTHARNHPRVITVRGQAH